MFKLLNRSVVLLLIMAIISAVIIFPNSGERYNILVVSLFYTICIVSLIGIFNSVDKLIYSLNKTFNIFYFFFFGLAPVIQYKFKSSFFDAPLLVDEDYMMGGSILLIILVIYLILYKMMFKYFESLGKSFFKVKPVSNEPLFLYYLLSLSSLVLIFILIKFDPEILFFRPPASFLKNNTYLGLLGYSMLLVLRPIPIIVLLRYLLIQKIERKVVVFLIILVLITVFPTSLSRGLIAAYFLPLVLLLIPLPKLKHMYSISYFFGVLVVFPILNFFRHSNNKVYLGLELFKTGHFDAFQNFTLLVKENIITGGSQLLGSILFFLPESIWKNKPLGTGVLLGQKLEFSHLNVAMPYFGEGFVNFGFIGILLFLILLVMFNSYLDVFYHKKTATLFMRMVYLFFLGFEFYLLRGDLTSSIKKISGFILALILVNSFFKFYQTFKKVKLDIKRS